MKRILTWLLACLFCLMPVGSALAAEDTASSIQEGYLSNTSFRWTKDADGYWVVLDAYGNPWYGWVQYGEDLYYLVPGIQPGYITSACEFLEPPDGEGYMWYAFDKDGKCTGFANGWHKNKYTSLYTYYTHGNIEQGWKTIGGVTYYLSPEMYYDGWYMVDGKPCYFDKSGAYQPSRKPPVTGWLTTWSFTYYDDKVYWQKDLYYYKNSTPVTGWYTVDGETYYFDPETGCAMVGQSFVQPSILGSVFDENGVLVTGSGWKKIFNTWYYFKNGAPLKGIQRIDGKDYYLLEESGAMCEYSDINDDGSFRAVRSDGSLVPYSEQLGWVKVHFIGDSYTRSTGSGWVYFEKQGVPAKGWKTIGGKKYYFDEYDGRMYDGGLQGIYNFYSGEIHQYFFGADGAMRTGWQQTVNVDGHKRWVYLDPQNGGIALQDEWRYIQGASYYFDGPYMATHWLLVDDSWYYFGADGAVR